MYAIKVFSDNFYMVMMEFVSNVREENGNSNADLGMEIHALSSATKPLCSWIARDAIQDCRESCGGHGYLKSKYKILYI